MAPRRDTARRSTLVDSGSEEDPDTNPIPAQRTSSPIADESLSKPGTITPPAAASPFWRRPGARRAALGAAALLQAVVIVAATSWIGSRSDAVEPRGATTPATWSGIVHGTGEAELNLRSTPEVADGNTSRTATSGDRLEILCGQTGDSVSGELGRTGVWLKTTDALYVSQLYVTVPGQTHVPRCSEPDVLLIEMPAQTASPSPSAGPATASPPTGGQGCGASQCGRSSRRAGVDRNPPAEPTGGPTGITVDTSSATPRPPVALGGASGVPTTTTTPRPGPTSDGNLGTAKRVQTDHDKRAPTKKRKKSTVG